ncbi:MAG: hypothetical protein Q8835_02710 [Sweet potato little leaf phytoplasma]|nr:hypothetical protein [Sweet potato little leaf phytoplasma]
MNFGLSSFGQIIIIIIIIIILSLESCEKGLARILLKERARF